MPKKERGKKGKFMPINNRYNYFFKRVFKKYRKRGYIPQKNYSYQDCRGFLKKLNNQTVLQWYYEAIALFMFGLTIVIIYLLSLLWNEIIVLIGVASLFVLLCLDAYLEQQKVEKLYHLVSKENEDLEKHKVKWVFGPNLKWLHLCVDYPKQYHTRGGYQKQHRAYRLGGILIKPGQTQEVPTKILSQKELIEEDILGSPKKLLRKRSKKKMRTKIILPPQDEKVEENSVSQSKVNSSKQNLLEPKFPISLQDLENQQQTTGRGQLQEPQLSQELAPHTPQINQELRSNEVISR